MGGLNTTLNIGVEALEATQGELDATSNNLSNANTPGYTEQTAELSENALTQSGGQIDGGGVTLDGITTTQDELLNLQIQQQTSLQSSASTQSGILNQIQTYFESSGTDIASTLTSFSSSLDALSANPANAADQQAVLDTGQNLTQSFNSTANGLTSAQASAASQATATVTQINTLTAKIAQINGEIAQLSAAGQNDDTQEDDLNQSVLQLAGLTGLSVTQSGGGVTITTGNGTPLVEGDQSFSLSSAPGSNGSVEVLDSNGNKITASITGGQLGGALTMSNTEIPQMLSQLNSLATQFANAFNSAQEQGVNASGEPGQAFFQLPADAANAAAGISVAITNPAELAVDSNTTSGGSNIANLTAAVANPLPADSATSSEGGLTASTGLTAGAVTSVTDAATGKTFEFTASTGATIGDLQNAIASAVVSGTLSNGTTLDFNSSGQAVISTTTPGDTLQVSSTDNVLGSFTSSGQTSANVYASLVDEVGNTASNASTESSAISSNLTSLTNQQSAATGVDIDTETANLIRYQTAYEAGARIISTMQQLLQDTMDMGSSQSY
ncbi:MAG: flagellar hook-associated protein FlgK [Acidobacteriaceae bacterium]